MNGVIGLISLSALLLVVSGQLSSLSPSYTFQGIRTVSGGNIPPYPVNVSVDITRGLESTGWTVSAGQLTESYLYLYSENDNATYLSLNIVCSEIMFEPITLLFPLNTNVWDLYAAGTELPFGTYTYTQDGAINQVTIVNGVPAVFTHTIANVVTTTTVLNFDNTTPDFSTFSLPSECSQFSCTACYQSSQTSTSPTLSPTSPTLSPTFLTLSPSFSYQGTETFDGASEPIYSISVSVDVARGLGTLVQIATVGNATIESFTLSSLNDNITYSSANSSMCSEAAFNSSSPAHPIDSNVWESFAAGTESPAGTFTITGPSISYQVTIVDGVPASFNVSGAINAVVIVTNFDNTTPDFSTFSLPSECSEFNCTACYSSAVSASISILLLLTTLLMYLLTTL